MAWPRTSATTLEELFGEIDEYFDSGARLRPGDTVLDVGANVGAFAIGAARRVGGDLDVYCVEPAPLPFAALECNVRRNTWLSRARPRLFNVALTSGAHAGTVLPLTYFDRLPCDSTFDLPQKRSEFLRYFEFHARRLRACLARGIGGRTGRTIGDAAASVMRDIPVSGWRRWLFERAIGQRTVPCRMETVGSVVAGAKLGRIDLLKVDVEGLESQVLAGIDAPTWARVQQAVVETQDHGEQVEDVLRALHTGGLQKTTTTRAHLGRERGLANVLVTALR